MNALFGIFSRVFQPVERQALEVMRSETNNIWAGPSVVWIGDCLGLGCTLDDTLTVNPSNANLQDCEAEGLVFVATGRVDNISELAHQLQISGSELKIITDSELMRRAYLQWGEASSERIFGDWSYAAWHPLERRLVLARDHHGYTPLYYYVDNDTFAFASCRRALMALKLAPLQLDELFLAQYLTSWMGYHGERTLHQPILRLPPSHRLCVTSKTFSVQRYWYLENVPEFQLHDRRDYIEAFLPLFDDAVRSRLRTNGKVACTISGGLDSSSVAATAALLLASKGARLSTFTSVPYSDTSNYLLSRFGDEFTYVQATARYSGNIDVQPLTSVEISPVSAIRTALQVSPELSFGAGNLFWILDILRIANERGCNVFMTGALGNGGISWYGDILSQPWSFIWSQLGGVKLANALYQRSKEKIMLALPIEITASMRSLRENQEKRCRMFAIRPAFAKRLNLFERMLRDPNMLPARNPKERRIRYLMPGRSAGGSYLAELGAAHGLEVRDPTADARVLAFCCSVPDNIFMDPKTGLDRWLIREAMKGRLPDEVRLNRNRGRQAGDLVPRLRACAGEVETALSELEHGPSAEYLDIAYMRQVWRLIQTSDTNEAFVKSIMVLTRGIMAGLFVNQFYDT